MFASFIPLFFFAAWLANALGLPLDAPVKDQPNGDLWLTIYLGVMTISLIAGYMLGWFANAFLSRYMLGWPLSKVVAVYMYSEIPQEWLKVKTSPVK